MFHHIPCPGPQHEDRCFMDGWHPRYLVVHRSVDIEQAFDLGVPCWAMSIIKVSLNWEKICKKKKSENRISAVQKEVSGSKYMVPWSGSFDFHFLISAFNNHVEQLHTFYRVQHSMWYWKVLSFYIVLLFAYIRKGPIFLLDFKEMIKI